MTIMIPSSGGDRNSSSIALLRNTACVVLLGLVLFISNNRVLEMVSPEIHPITPLVAAGEESEEKNLMANNTSTSAKSDHMPASPVHKINLTRSLPNSQTYRRMEEFGSSLELSRRQQASFDNRKDLLPLVFSPLRRFQANLIRWGANLLTDDYAYIHIFKNGGTTIAAQTGNEHMAISNQEVQRRKWMALVRDPIEHFLSGWGECGKEERNFRLSSKKIPRNTPFDPNGNETVPASLRANYDQRINTWLRRVKLGAKPGHGWKCEIHSFPQINTILNGTGVVPENLEILGDLKELPAALRLVGFHYNHTIDTGRNATANTFLHLYFPRRTDLLTNETFKRLCDFLAIDYFTLDYPLPPQCKDMPVTGFSDLINVPTKSDIRHKKKDNVQRP